MNASNVIIFQLFYNIKQQITELEASINNYRTETMRVEVV
jgi:hypothetical protein